MRDIVKTILNKIGFKKLEVETTRDRFFRESHTTTFKQGLNTVTVSIDKGTITLVRDTNEEPHVINYELYTIEDLIASIRFFLFGHEWD